MMCFITVKRKSDPVLENNWLASWNIVSQTDISSLPCQLGILSILDVL